MVEIKDISGKTKFSTPINKGAKGKFTLMKEDYIILPFSVSEPIYFKLGDYVDLSGVLDDSLGGLMSKRYEIVDLQTPTFNSSTGGYDYQLRLDAYYWKWKNKIFKIPFLVIISNCFYFKDINNIKNALIRTEINYDIRSVM